VQFNGSRSGGVSYVWDFGDNSADSTEADPRHTYQEEGDYTATLTVTYADGSTSTDKIEINVLGEPDTTPPVTTATFNPADPGNGGTYDRPVTLTLTATDGDEGTGIGVIEYRIDGGAWQTYTAPFRVARVGNHLVEYRATDRSGNVEDIKNVTFSIVLHPACLTATDEFNAATLDPKWTVENPTNDGALTVGDGGVSIKVRNGDMIGGTATARNMLLQTAPSGQWIVDTKLNITQLANEGEQAGLVLVESISPNNFVKIVYINKGGGTRWFEYVLTEGDSTIRLPNSGNQNIPASGDVYLRAVSNGSGTVRAYWSLDGTNWTQVGPDITGLDIARVGVKVSDNANTENAAKFDYFRLDCADRAAPVTFGTVSPETPNGKLGWYDDAPTITLEATDGELGSGVARTEYRYGTTGLFQTYTGPFEVDQDGPLTIQYRSTDGADTPNTEAIKTLSLKVDDGAPQTTATLDPAQPGTGPVTVSLNADDGAGSGLDTLEYRVDGGNWQTYSAPASDRTLLDGTQASFSRWRQAGPGSFTLQGDGSIHANGGLGMLWYTGEPFGDFALRFQFRDAQTGTAFSNGGAFVRFPHPDETTAAPPAARPSCVSPTENREEWVAIFCGHEIQVYDGPTGEVQKTGSIYNFDPLTLPQSGADQRTKGEWNDYEIRVVGQQYTIIRNGAVINTFDNGLPRESSRGGDPPTQARQFAQGYIGFQNHGNADLIQYRNVRVQKLDGASRTGSGPFTVSGAGNHTVEFRSTDWAGHTEDKKSITFRIASTTQNPGVAPEERPTFRLAGLRGGTAKRFASRGLVVRVTCTGEMEGRVQVTATRKVMRRLGLKGTRLAGKFVRCADAGTRAVTVKPSRKVARKLRRARRAVKVTVTVRLASAGQSPTTVTRRLTLRR
jgi:PKD repeat protein